LVRTAADIFRDKIRLAYEYNRKSPLFVHIAHWEMENNNPGRAIEILNEGIEEFPDYPTAYFLLGKALVLAGEPGNALNAVKKGSEIINSVKTYDYYLRRIELNEEAEPDEKVRTFNETDDGITFSKPAGSGSIDERLEELAKEISDAKIPAAGNQPAGDYSISGFSDDSMIVSETLAKIYLSQGEYKEAIEVFEKLKKKNPDKADYYSDKIAEIIRKMPETPEP
jgi:tetratricopeptide (TPR) repeat protein